MATKRIVIKTSQSGADAGILFRGCWGRLGEVFCRLFGNDENRRRDRAPRDDPNSWEFCSMDWPDYLRDEAAKYRHLAEQTDDPVVKDELLELASVCDEVASNIEDRLTGG